MTLTPIQYAAKLDRLHHELTSPEAVAELLTHLGMEAKGDVKDGVVADLGGDHRMSNWPRRTGKQMPMGGRFDLTSPTVMEVKPDRYSAGPFAMLEDGRRVRRVGQFASKGRGRNKGGAYTRLRLVTRPVGPMAPKRTWSDAEDVVRRRFPARLERWKNGRLSRVMRG